MLSYLQEGDKF